MCWFDLFLLICEGGSYLHTDQNVRDSREDKKQEVVNGSVWVNVKQIVKISKAEWKHR